MVFWIILMIFSLFLFILSFFYIANRITKVFILKFLIGITKLKLLSIIFLAIIFLVIAHFINFVNAFVCFIYFTFMLGICDIIYFVLKKFFNIHMEYYLVMIMAIILLVIVLLIGLYNNYNVSITKYNLFSDKAINDLKIAFFADSHIGTTFDYNGFAKHMKTIKNLNPDILFVVGDYVDDDTTRINMINSSKALGNLDIKYGIYYVYGNHDRGYYNPARRGFDGNDLYMELKKNNVNILKDESILIDDSFYVIGREDYSIEKERKGKRESIHDLTKDLDKSKYMIVLDHQPVDYQNDASENVDLVLSGHTHGGQLFPFNNLGKLLNINDLVYGMKRIKYTTFIVTSGISCWSIKFKLKTKSEIVLVNINNKNKI